MKKYIKNGIMAVVALLGLWSCANEDKANEQTATEGQASKVVLSLNSGGIATRAAVTHNDREKAIDVNNTFAVIFDYDSKNGKAYSLTKEGDDYTFEVPETGVYYLYVVANTLVVADGDTFADPTALMAKVETGNPGSADDNTATNFLMHSPKTLLDIDGKNDTEVSVTLTRAAARIDIEAFAGFTITNVDVTNRYVTSVFGRSTTPTAMETELSGAKQATKAYTGLTGDGITANKWEGAIYVYENLSDAVDEKTKVKVTGTNAESESFSVEGTFDNIKRNHAYKLVITNNEETPTFDKLKANILIAPWNPDETFVYTSLTDVDTPEFYVTTADYNEVTGGTVVGTETKNPTKARLSRTTAKDCYIRVVGKKVGSQIVCEDGADGITIDETETSNDGNGNIQQIFKITFDQLSKRSKTVLSIYNQLNEPNPLTFTIDGFDIGMNPLWWCGEYNVNQNLSSFDKQQNYNQGYMFTFTSLINSKFSYTKESTGTGSGYDGWKTFSTDPAKVAARTIDGVAWHLPTLQEFVSIIPTADELFNYNNTTSHSVDLFSTSTFKTANLSTPSISDIVNESKCVFGFDETTQAGLVSQSYWSEPLESNNLRYAIRFIGTEYCSAWRWHFINMGEGNTTARLEITSRLINKIPATDAQALANEMTKMKTDASYWSSDKLTENEGGVQRVFYATGHPASTSIEQHCVGSRYNGVRCLYWTATNSLPDGTRAYTLDTYRSNRWLFFYSEIISWAWPGRLFRDK